MYPKMGCVATVENVVMVFTIVPMKDLVPAIGVASKDISAPPVH